MDSSNISNRSNMRSSSRAFTLSLAIVATVFQAASAFDAELVRKRLDSMPAEALEAIDAQLSELLGSDALPAASATSRRLLESPSSISVGAHAASYEPTVAGTFQRRPGELLSMEVRPPAPPWRPLRGPRESLCTAIRSTWRTTPPAPLAGLHPPSGLRGAVPRVRRTCAAPCVTVEPSHAPRAAAAHSEPVAEQVRVQAADGVLQQQLLSRQVQGGRQHALRVRDPGVPVVAPRDFSVGARRAEELGCERGGALDGEFVGGVPCCPAEGRRWRRTTTACGQTPTWSP